MTKFSIHKGQGYLLADNTASGGDKKEADLLGCPHCGTLMERPQWETDLGGYCYTCGQPVCPTCTNRMQTRGCENFLRRLEGALEQAYRRDQMSKVLGL